MLQWGHNFIVMEMYILMRFLTSTFPCFNGAITLSLWKFHMKVQPLVGMLASMGP